MFIQYRGLHGLEQLNHIIKAQQKMRRFFLISILASVALMVNSTSHRHHPDRFRGRAEDSSAETHNPRTPGRRVINSESPAGFPNQDPRYPVGENTPGFNVSRPADPNVITRVNSGVSTILNGVGRARLSEILRGSFMFTRNENVRSVANTVIDSIFGPRDEAAIRERKKDGVAPLSGL